MLLCFIITFLTRFCFLYIITNIKNIYRKIYITTFFMLIVYNTIKNLGKNTKKKKRKSMLNLFVLKESFTSGYNYDVLHIISLISIICGISVIISKNPIVSVLFLIGLFLGIAAYLMTLGINFIGLSYLLVYVGAVSILFLFILMLINVRVSELVTDNTNSIPLAIIIGIIFNMAFHKLLPYSKYNSYLYSADRVNYYGLLGIDNKVEADNLSHELSNSFLSNDTQLLHVTSQVWDGVIAEASHITSIGNIIYTAYPLWLFLTSIILLLAMVGAIVITIKQ